MKKISIVLIIGIISVSIITSNVNAQLIRGKNDASTSFNEGGSITKIKSPEKMDKATSKSLKSFNKDFRNEQSVKWFAEPSGITASFKNGDVSTKVVYNSKGQWIHTIKTYHENSMDAATRTIVKSKYFDDAITMVQEVREGDAMFFLVYLENNSTYRIVCVYDGEMNVYKEFKKQM
ncbi:MAG: hypothetical protein M3Z92_13355 [Bacteroidota bacterium]|nr:hypothetical protein [Bacteroidota bacterium]